MSLAIASILKEEGFIEDFESYEKIKKIPINVIEIYRKTRNPVICKIKRISKTRIVYSNSKELPRVLDDLELQLFRLLKE
jgi:small subunit ribosomal protein S8